jgi:hypothetical protein
MPECLEPHETLFTHPIAVGSSGRSELIERCQNELDNVGACCLREFVTAETLSELVAEAQILFTQAHQGFTQSSAYYVRSGAGYPADHPLNVKLSCNFSLVAGDLIWPGSRLRAIYESPVLGRFLADILKRDHLYPMADRYQCLNLSVIQENGHQHWHFDASDFVVTLMIQAPLSGGEFEYAPRVRSKEQENFEMVAKIIDGQSDDTRIAACEAGTLMIFQGEYSLHRVRPTRGSQTRIVGILSYDTQPGRIGKYESNIKLYGSRILPQR